MEILIVEDDATTRALLTQLLTSRGHHATACESGEQAAECYRQSFYPLVILDLLLPGMSGFEFCRWLRGQADGERPYVLVGTASRAASDLHEILAEGADDYLVKPYDIEVFAVRLAVAEQAIKVRAARRQLADELTQEREHLAYLASHDPLTKLANRALFTSTLENAVTQAGASLRPGALLYLDLDHFKIVNASLGHAAGDRLLVQIAYLLRNAVREGDTVARFGGNSFLVLQENITAAEARMTAERIRARINDLVFCDSGRTSSPGVSVGVAEITGQASAGHVLAAADTACYSAKARGRNRVEAYQPDDGSLSQLRTDSHWAAQIRHALKENTFEVRRQPVVEIDSHRAVFHETLLRLRTTDGEIVVSDRFLPAAERFQMGPEIDRRLIRLAARQMAADPDLHLAIHLSGQSLGEVSLVDFIRKAFAPADIAPRRVTLEITEAAALSQLDAARAMMERLGKEGFRFALTCFGAGSSSFTSLRNLPVDFLKIDDSFIRDLTVEPANLTFVKALNDIARRRGVYCGAGRGEDAATLRALRSIGVRHAQGQYFTPPVSSATDAGEEGGWESYTAAGKSGHIGEVALCPAGV